MVSIFSRKLDRFYFFLKKFSLHRMNNVTKIVTRGLEDKACVVLFIHAFLRRKASVPSHNIATNTRRTVPFCLYLFLTPQHCIIKLRRKRIII